MRTTFDALGANWQSLAPGAGVDTHSETDSDAPQRRYRAVFISDIHLGTAGCQAEALLDFLKHHDSDYLYLVGDIVDGWQLRRRGFWPQRCGAKAVAPRAQRLPRGVYSR
jgi:predicted MPP superfamily phosphohydrolase